MKAEPSNQFQSVAASPSPACQRLLDLPLARPAEAEEELIEVLDSTLQAPPDQAVMFPLLEQSRSALCFIREAAVRRHLDQAPHLDSDGERQFRRGVAATERMMRCYTVCTGLSGDESAATLENNPERARQEATVLHRCLFYSGMLIFEHFRAKRDLPAGTWARHNALYATASRLGIATLPVEDRMFEQTRTSHCQAAFVVPLLVDQTSPYGRSPRDLNLIWQWAEKAALEVAVRCGAQAPLTAAYGVDLEGDAPLRPLALIRRNPGTVQLETAALTGGLRRVLDELARGASPERLGLCEEGLDQSKTLMRQLESLWALESAQRRRHARVRGDGRVRLWTGFEAVHHTLLRAVSAPPSQARRRAPEPESAPQPTGHWEIVDRGASGFRLASGDGSSRLFPHQLVALRVDDGSGLLLGQVAWLKKEQSGRLLAGVGIFPAGHQAVFIRATGAAKAGKGPFCRAFLVGGQPDLRSDFSLVLSRPLASRNAEIEVIHERCWQVVLGEVIEKGMDFTRLGLNVA